MIQQDLSCRQGSVTLFVSTLLGAVLAILALGLSGLAVADALVALGARRR